MSTDHSGNRPAPAAGPRPTHDCPGGCKKQVAFELFACRPCWYRLPYAMRQAINRTYGKDMAGHATAMQAARDWYASHTGAWK